MGKAETNFEWIEAASFEGPPSHAQILDRLETAIRDGDLQSGDRLPAQRQLAAKLSVDLTTVTRAYSAARARGLVEGTVGRGTFVRERGDDGGAPPANLATNNPPIHVSAPIGTLLAETAASLAGRSDLHSLIATQHYLPSAATNAAAARWLEPVLGAVHSGAILKSPGAQPALATILTGLCRPGDAIITSALTHPGLLWLAHRFGWRLVPCPADAAGLEPEALARLCATENPTAIYVIPTAHNPTAVTTPLERRKAIAEVARSADVWIVEADPFSPFLTAPPPAIASLAPERTFYYFTFSKVFGASIRLAYLVAPDQWVAPTATGLRAMSLSASPLMDAVMTRWIEDGVALRLVEAMRSELRLRREMAAAILPQALGGPQSPHLWLPLASSRVSERMRLGAQDRGVTVATEEAFAVDQNSPAGLRVTLGTVVDRPRLEQALRILAEIVQQPVSSTPSFL